MRKIRILFFFLTFLFFGLVIFVYTLSSQTKMAGLNKLADVKVPTPTTAPTFTPSPTPSPTPIPTSTPTQTPTPELTSIPTPTIIIIASPELDTLFTKYANEYSIDKELLKRIANCESTLNPNASTKYYAGLFQFSESLWIQTRTLIGKDPDVNLRYNPEEAIRTAAFMVSQGRLGIWPNCGR
ncbi:MAG: transglycosylase SLT domain-containing protein [Patescibacteria group bacterium]|nr:transglycosylase SLT domain-containing protein [Actinomycetota bacterium]MCL5438639.1 transglycosylase SLT domain-containing protein [Patescibacteria group bacterium]